MVAISTKSTRRAIVEEVSEGTPAAVTGSSDLVALQEGFDHGFAFETLDNAEIKASIGQAKSILGLETSTPTMSHYLRHSGVEGTAPGYKALLKSLFGSEDVRSTERDVVSATTTTITVGAGEGVEFSKGDMLLIKDSVNGYAIRPVESVSTDTLTLGFAVSVAPAALVNLGLGVDYKPTDSGHTTLSIWDYLGNGGAIKLSSGNRVVSGTFNFEAGQIINADYSMEGIKVFFDPVTMTTSNNKMDFDDGSGEENVSVPVGVYKDPLDFAAALESAMNGATSDTITVTYSSSTGLYTVASDGSTLELLFATGSNTAESIAGELGFAVADQTAALTYTSATAIDLSSPFAPSYDSSDPLVAKSNLFFLGDATDNVCVPASTVSVSITNTKANITSICSESGVSSSLITGREVTVSASFQLDQYDAARFHRFHKNQTTRAMYAFGSKTGGNWDAGKSGALYMPTCVISSYETADQDSYQIVNLELTAFVNDNGEGEVFLGFV